MKNGQVKKSNAERGSFFSRHKVFCSFILSFVCCAVFFGAIMAVILNHTVLSHQSSSAANGSSSQPLPSKGLSSGVSYSASSSFTMLVGIYSDSDGVPVQFLLYRLDTINKRTVVMPVPVQLAVNRQNTVCPLGGVYKSGGISGAKSALQNLLSVKIDYTCDIGSGNFLKIFDKLGGLYGTVPENISFTMPGSSSSISLAASSEQYLSGTKIYALISFQSYSNNTVRYKEQSALMKEFVSEKLTGLYIENSSAYYGNIFNYVSTDFSMNELLNHADSIKALSSSNLIVTPLPSYSASSSGTGLLQFVQPAAVTGYFS